MVLLDFKVAVDAVVITDVQLWPDGREVVCHRGASHYEGRRRQHALAGRYRGGPAARLTTAPGVHPRRAGHRSAAAWRSSPTAIGRLWRGSGCSTWRAGREGSRLTGRQGGFSGLE